MGNQSYFKKFWHFIWEDNSIWSWIVNVVLAFILIKFIVFPVLGYLLGSSFPVVAVVSSSMEHDTAFEQWWNSQAICSGKTCTQGKFYSEFNITEDQFKNFRFSNGFNKGDVMILTSSKNIKIGDTIVFISGDGRPIIHRVISLNPLETKGDHNIAQISTSIINEGNVQAYPLIGKASFRIPYIGYIKIIFADLLSAIGLQVS